MRRRKRRGVSLGTVFMLLLTLLVVLGSAGFLMMIAGDDLYERTGELIRSLSEQGFTETMYVPDTTNPPAAAAARFYVVEETAQPTSQPTAKPVPRPVTITLAAAGSVYAPKSVRESAQGSGGQYDFSPVFAGLGDALRDADLTIATLETTTAGKDKGFGNYNTTPEILTALRGSGVDLLALATEHALDKGYEGLDLTVSELTANGLLYAGAYPDGRNTGATMVSIAGVQVAVLAYTYGLSDESAQKTNSDSRGAVPLLNMEQVIRDVTQARVAGANLVVVLPHWGTKNKADTPDALRRMARELAQAGADVILGSHPNVVLDAERIRVTRSDGLEYDAVVCYSLGSLLTDARTKENTAGAIAHLSVTHDPQTRRTTLGDFYCTPVYIAKQREDGQTAYRVVDPESEQGIELLEESEQQAAREAMEIIRSAIEEQEGQG